MEVPNWTSIPSEEALKNWVATAELKNVSLNPFARKRLAGAPKEVLLNPTAVFASRNTASAVFDAGRVKAGAASQDASALFDGGRV